MGEGYIVKSKCLRYVIPFKFTGTFEDNVSAIESQKEEILKKNKETGQKEKNGEFRQLWVRRTVQQNHNESDLYSYIRNEFLFDDMAKALSEQKTGCAWTFWRSNESDVKDGQKIKELLFFENGISKSDATIPEAMNISVNNLGIYLFRNGLGFAWYELGIINDDITSNQLKKFQNNIKELNRGSKTNLWEKTNNIPIVGAILKEEKRYTTYIQPFSIGKWIQDTLGVLDVDYFAGRESAYASMLKKSMSNINGDEISIIDADISDIKTSMVPDKALLFSYVSFENPKGNQDDREALAYHLANGYKDSYHYSCDNSVEMKRPFAEAIWYATQEGATYLTWPEEDNKEVFDNLIPSKIRGDYFTLFIKAVYQSYSLLMYSEMIQEEISAVNGKYLVEPLDKRITELFGEINLFLTKSMATSISHIHHQSEYYIYLKEQLRIHADVKSVTAGLNALDILQREQRQREESRRVAEEWQAEQRRDKEEQLAREALEAREKKSDGKIQAIMGLFAMLGISSALVDCFDFISKFSDGEKWSELPFVTQCIEVAFISIIGGISIIAIVFAIKAIVDAFHDK